MKGAILRLPEEVRRKNAVDASALDSNVVALDKALTVKNHLAVMREANQITRLAANPTTRYKPPIPVEVTLLDYYGRELEIGAAAKDMGKLKAAAEGISHTWKILCPSIEERGGRNATARFDTLTSLVAAEKSAADYGRLATLVLDEVDNLEKVFLR